MQQKTIQAVARNGKVEMSRDDFLLLIRLAGGKIETIESIRITTPAVKGPEPGRARKKREAAKKTE